MKTPELFGDDIDMQFGRNKCAIVHTVPGVQLRINMAKLTNYFVGFEGNRSLNHTNHRS